MSKVPNIILGCLSAIGVLFCGLMIAVALAFGSGVDDFLPIIFGVAVLIAVAILAVTAQYAMRSRQSDLQMLGLVHQQGEDGYTPERNLDEVV